MVATAAHQVRGSLALLAPGVPGGHGRGARDTGVFASRSFCYDLGQRGEWLLSGFTFHISRHLTFYEFLTCIRLP